MTLDPRSLSVFVAAAQNGSLGQAARQMNLTQPAVTRIIRRLEEYLGVPVFERTTTGVVMTAYGQALLPYAGVVLSELENARTLMTLLRGASKGVVRVGGVGSVTSTYLARALRALLLQEPGLRIHVIEEIEDELLDALKRGEIDLAISPEPYADDQIALACPETLHDRVEVFAAPDHPLLDLDRVGMEDARNHNWALPPSDTPVTREWRRRFLARGIDNAEPSIHSRSVNTIKSLAVLGGVLCWMPRSLVAAELAEGKLRPVEIPELLWDRTFHVYRRRMGHLSPPARLMLRELQGLSASLQWDG